MANTLKPSNYLLCRHRAGHHPGAHLWDRGAELRLAVCASRERPSLPQAPQALLHEALLQSCWGAGVPEMPCPQNSSTGRWCSPQLLSTLAPDLPYCQPKVERRKNKIFAKMEGKQGAGNLGWVHLPERDWGEPKACRSPPSNPPPHPHSPTPHRVPREFTKLGRHALG